MNSVPNFQNSQEQRQILLNSRRRYTQEGGRKGAARQVTHLHRHNSINSSKVTKVISKYICPIEPNDSTLRRPPIVGEMGLEVER
ncbi:hypothetical protein AAHA92_21822 [Salvia divinorum]|uniref:Uncharacterized protein n=1 Tax=Salvia divinorum TaxID=28513 RepID=A0ABD1GLP3_SALDI